MWVEGYAHDAGKVVLGCSRDLHAGRPDLLDGGVDVIQLYLQNSMVHWRKKTNEKSLYNYTFSDT